MAETESKKSSPFIVLYRLVKEMRAQQKQYFATKSTTALVTSKEFEKAVDKVVLEIEEEAEKKGIQL